METFMKRLGTPILLTLALCLSAAAQGQDSNKLPYRGSKDDQEACTPDVFRLCQQHVPDERRILACLKQNMKNLSPACRKVLS
jgi:cysteine rich repeat protein